jgi:hypothetical protein
MCVLCRLRCVVCVVSSALCRLRCVVCVVLFALCCLRCVVCVVLFALCRLRCVVCVVSSALCCLRCVVCVVLFALCRRLRCVVVCVVSSSALCRCLRCSYALCNVCCLVYLFLDDTLKGRNVISHGLGLYCLSDAHLYKDTPPRLRICEFTYSNNLKIIYFLI